MRFCIDYRALNIDTIKQQFQIPNTEYLYMNLRKGHIFTKLDLESAYHQIETKESDKYKTGFITQDGCFEWNVNAVQPQERAIHLPTNCTEGSNKFIIVYLDDTCVF